MPCCAKASKKTRLLWDRLGGEERGGENSLVLFWGHSNLKCIKGAGPGQSCDIFLSFLICSKLPLSNVWSSWERIPRPKSNMKNDIWLMGWCSCTTFSVSFQGQMLELHDVSPEWNKSNEGSQTCVWIALPCSEWHLMAWFLIFFWLKDHLFKRLLFS